MPKCLYCYDEIPEGMMVCPTCLDNLTPSGDCRKCLHFNYCTDCECFPWCENLKDDGTEDDNDLQRMRSENVLG